MSDNEQYKNEVQYRQSEGMATMSDSDYEIMPGTEPWVMPMIYGGSFIPATWSIKVYELVTGSYAFRLVEHAKSGDIDHEMWGGFDQPWAALGWAVGQIKEMPNNGT